MEIVKVSYNKDRREIKVQTPYDLFVESNDEIMFSQKNQKEAEKYYNFATYRETPLLMSHLTRYADKIKIITKQDFILVMESAEAFWEARDKIEGCINSAFSRYAKIEFIL